MDFSQLWWWEAPVRVPAWSDPGKSRLAVPSHGRGERGLCEVSFIKALIPLPQALPSWPKHLLKIPLPKIITTGNRLQYWNLGWGVPNIQGTECGMGWQLAISLYWVYTPLPVTYRSWPTALGRFQSPPAEYLIPFFSQLPT